jgi:nitrile hydratase beta subunit
MDGVHDLGGVEGFGAPAWEGPDEPVFHHDWERRAMGLTFCGFGLGLNNGGQFRHSIERMEPAHYLGSRYYEHWATSVATRLVETGRLTPAELEERAGGGFPLARPVASSGITFPSLGPDLAVGDRVVVRDIRTAGHSRCPAYVRGRTGEVVRVDEVASVPDIEAHQDDRRYEAVVCVRFSSRELWGEGAEDAAIHVDLWACYLERAE